MPGTTVFIVRLGSRAARQPDEGLGGRSRHASSLHRQPAPAIVTAIGPEKETPAATTARVVDALDPDFDLVADSNSAGTYDLATRTLTWIAGELGDAPQTLTYTVKHNKSVLGVSAKQVSQSVTYTSDQEPAGVALDNPSVFVRPCGEILDAGYALHRRRVHRPRRRRTSGGTGIAQLALNTGTGNTTLFLTMLDAVPAGVCGGNFTNSFVQADVLPPADKLIVTLFNPGTQSGPLLGLTKICLGTNLTFRTRGFGTGAAGERRALLRPSPLWHDLHEPERSVGAIAEHQPRRIGQPDHHPRRADSRHEGRVRGPRSGHHRVRRTARLRPEVGYRRLAVVAREEG